MPNQETWPQFRADTSFHHAFAELDVNLPKIAQHLADRGVEEDVIGSHTLSLTASPKSSEHRIVGGRYHYEQAWIDLYPEKALSIALGHHISTGIETDDWNQPVELQELTERLLNEWLTHELQHVVDFNEPGAWEANQEYKRGTNRMLRRHMYGVGAAGLGFTVALNKGMDVLSHLNPQMSPILASLGMLAAGTMGFGAMSRHMNAFGMALGSVRYNNNPFERSANAAEATETGDFFAVKLTPDVDTWAKYSIGQYRRYILRA